MTDEAAAAAPKTPVWFWILAVIATLWNFMGVFDYWMTQLSVEAYLASFTDAQREYFTSFPLWFVVIWTVAVHLAFIASLAMFARTRFMAPMFAACIVMFVVNATYQYAFTPALEMMGTSGAIFAVVIFLSLIGLWWVGRIGVAKGFLR